MNVQEIFGTNIRKYRIEKNLTQSIFAEQLGISTTHMARLETGKHFPKANLLNQITSTLNISIAELFLEKNMVLLDMDSEKNILTPDRISKTLESEISIFVSSLKKKLKI